MQAIAHLVPLAAEPEVGKGLAAQPAVEPKGEDSLVGAAKLSGARQHTASVDENRKAESLPVFQGEGLAR